MTVKDIKHEIHKVIDDLPDTIANDVLDYLKSFLNRTPKDISLTTNLTKILNEDKQLLERLAQ